MVQCGMLWPLLCLVSLLIANCGRLPIGRKSHPERMPDLIFADTDDTKDVEVLPNSYIVAFRPDLPSNEALHSSSYKQEYQKHYLSLQERGFLDEAAVTNIDYLTTVDLRAGYTGDPLAIAAPQTLQLALTDNDFTPLPAAIAKVDFVDEPSAQATLKDWHDKGKIWFAEPNYVSHLSQDSKTYEDLSNAYKTTATQAVWFDQIKLVEGLKAMHDAGKTLNQAPLIAVMDSGVDYQHPDLKAHIFENTTGLNQAGCRNDQYGCNTTQSGKGTLGNGEVWPTGTSQPNEACPTEVHACHHGTHVAGIVASDLKEGYGGICPVCQIIIVRILGKTARGEGNADAIIDSSIIAGFSYISRFKSQGDAAIRVVNASFGKFQRSRSVELLVRSLRSLGHGVLVVAAAGNEDTMKRQYPAAFNDVIAVANVEADTGIKHTTSNYGRWVDVSAPGSRSDIGNCPNDAGILSTIPGNQTLCATGTSMSSPVVAGVAGLLLAFDPQMSFDDLRSKIVETANPDIYQNAENRPYYPNLDAERFPIPLLGSGVVNVENAIKGVIPESKPVSEALKRVTGECGVVNRRQGASQIFMFLLMGLPLLIMVWGRKLKSGKTSRG